MFWKELFSIIRVFILNWILKSETSLLPGRRKEDFLLLCLKQCLCLSARKSILHYNLLNLQGSDCPFNHDYQPQKRLELCKYYVQSYCKRDGCMFLHEEFPCKYYHTGSTCYQGDTCKFSHAPLTQETEMALQNVSGNSRSSNLVNFCSSISAPQLQRFL